MAHVSIMTDICINMCMSFSFVMYKQSLAQAPSESIFARPHLPTCPSLAQKGVNACPALGIHAKSTSLCLHGLSACFVQPLGPSSGKRWGAGGCKGEEGCREEEGRLCPPLGSPSGDGSHPDLAPILQKQPRNPCAPFRLGAAPNGMALRDSFVFSAGKAGPLATHPSCHRLFAPQLLKLW